MLNSREIDVLNILCSAHKPMTSTDITNQMMELTQSTVIAVLRRLMAEDIVSVTGVTHSGKVLSRTYEPGARAKEVVEEHYRAQFAATRNIISAKELQALIDSSLQ